MTKASKTYTPVAFITTRLYLYLTFYTIFTPTRAV